MPFSTQNPQAFDLATVQALPNGLYGVYGLFKGNVWIYVGKGEIRDRLLAHLRGDKPCITREKPTHWVAEVFPVSAREEQLIKEFNPICNTMFVAP